MSRQDPNDSSGEALTVEAAWEQWLACHGIPDRTIRKEAKAAFFAAFAAGAGEGYQHCLDDNKQRPILTEAAEKQLKQISTALLRCQDARDFVLEVADILHVDRSELRQ